MNPLARAVYALVAERKPAHHDISLNLSELELNILENFSDVLRQSPRELAAWLGDEIPPGPWPGLVNMVEVD